MDFVFWNWNWIDFRNQLIPPSRNGRLIRTAPGAFSAAANFNNGYNANNGFNGNNGNNGYNPNNVNNFNNKAALQPGMQQVTFCFKV